MVPKIRNDLEPHYRLHQVCTKLLREAGKYLTRFHVKKALATFRLLERKFHRRYSSQIPTVALVRTEKLEGISILMLQNTNRQSLP